MKCPNCGMDNDSTNIVCSQCGSTLNQSDELTTKVEDNISINEEVSNNQFDESTNEVENNASVNEEVLNSQNADNNVENSDNQVNNEVQLQQSNEEIVQPNQEITNDTNQQSNDELNMFENYDSKNSIFSKIGRFIGNHIKIFGIALVALIIALIGINIFKTLHDGTKLNWVKNEGYEISAVTPSGVVNLDVEAFDEDKNEITDIKYSVSGGEIKAEGNKVEWTLPDEEGKYTITASLASGKKIKKQVKVQKFEQKNDNKELTIQYEEEKSDDYDADGLKNEEENKIGTNPRIKDTDHDGINDYEEVNTTKTDPLKADTDGDGLNDADELALGLDPLKEDSKGDGIKDGERTLTYNTKFNSEVILQVNGKGNLASTTTIDVFENTAFNKVKGVSNKVYVFYTKGKMDNATVKIKYDVNDIKKKGLNEKNLILYYFNEETKEFEPQQVKLDIKNKIITANLSHFSKYVIGDNTVVSKDNTANIMFVIDNSVSMYSEKQMVDAGYNSSSGAVGNDKDFKRLSLTNDMVKKFTGNYKFGVAEFSGDYVNIEKFTSEKEKVMKSVDALKSNWKSNMSGTDIIDALENGISEFDKNINNTNYLILLTDGKNTSGYFSKSTQENIINSAKEKEVKICTIGLGNVDSSELKYISEQTGCDFYSASNSSTLDDIYTRLGADINYNLVDTNNDNKIDGTIIYDSGFIVTRDGFPFANYGTKQSEGGNCYGMATFAMLYYTNKLPMKLGEITTKTGFIVGKDKLSSDGYDLSFTYFTNHKNLYDFAFNNEALKIFLTRNEPSDFRYQGRKDVWRISSKYRTTFEDSGFDIYVKNNKYERFELDIESDKYKNIKDKDDRELLNAIWRLFTLQYEDEKISFETDPDKAYDTLVSNLKDGNPIVFTMSYKDGSNHAVNAVRLIQHNDNPNDFEIEIYDNNYPGEVKYVSLQRYKANFNISSATTWFNDYEYYLYYGSDNIDGIKANIAVLNLK